MTESSRNLPRTLTALLLLVLGVLAASWLRYHVANSDPLWLDELHSVWVTHHHPKDVYEAAAAGNQAPLYFWVLKAIPYKDPQAPLSLRWFSIGCAALWTASVGLFIFYWARSLPAAAIGVFLTAIDPNFIFYGSEARPYALLVLIVLWQFFAFLLCTTKSSRVEGGEVLKTSVEGKPTLNHLVAFAILSLLLVMTHHTGVLLLATEVLIIISLGLSRRQSRKSSLTIVGVLLAVSGVAFTLQAGSITSTFEHRGRWSSISSISELLRSYAPTFVYLGLIPLGVLAISSWLQRTVRRGRIELVLCSFAWALGPALLACLSDKLGLAPLALYRYTLVGAVAFPILAGLSISTIRRPALQAVVGTAILALSIFGPLPQLGSKQTLGFRFANEFITQNTPKLLSGDPIRMRYESWDSATNLLKNSDAPVFLFANLLEDEILEADRKARRDSNPKFVDYLKFPLTHRKEIDPVRIIPRSSHSGVPFLNHDLDRVANLEEFWIVIRGDAGMVQRILGQLHSSLSADGSFSAIYNQYRLAEQENDLEWLTVVKVTLR